MDEEWLGNGSVEIRSLSKLMGIVDIIRGLVEQS